MGLIANDLVPYVIANYNNFLGVFFGAALFCSLLGSIIAASHMARIIKVRIVNLLESEGVKAT